MAEPVRLLPNPKKERYREIGRHLRRTYNDVVNEPIPDDFTQLLKKLAEQSNGGSETTS